MERLRIKPDVLGQRLSVRTPRGDFVGDLIAIQDQSIQLLTRTGPTLIQAAEISAWRVVGAPRGSGIPLTARIDQVEWASHLTWAAPIQREYDGWWLRAANGFSLRANSVLPIRAPGLVRDLSKSLQVVKDFYDQQGINPLIQIPQPSYQPLQQELMACGWQPKHHVLVMTARNWKFSLSAEIKVHSSPSRAWLSLHDRNPDETGMEALTSGEPYFLELSKGEELIAIARLGIAHEWVGLGAVKVKTEFHRMGKGELIVTHALALATSLGIHQAFLQVDPGNAPAIGLYQKLGFSEHHTNIFLTGSQ